MQLTQGAKRLLLAEARRAVEFGLETGTELLVAETDYRADLRGRKATFVTLRHGSDLLGCVGTTRAVRPLVVDVVHNAFSAALHDPRFGPMSKMLLRELDVRISILSALEKLPASSEASLLAQLRPGVDGLLLGDGERRATFLPVMWEELPEPAQFLRWLKEKAGLETAEWPPTMEAFRYTTTSVP